MESLKKKVDGKKTDEKTKSEEEHAWSEMQQNLLEVALKKHPASLSATTRWTKISKDVPGKNKQQCVDRYKYLSSIVKSKK